MKTNTPSFVIHFLSDRPLEEVAAILSEKVLGGLPLGGKEDTIRDEEPAVYADGIFGARFILMGGPNEYGYDFEMNTPLPDYPGISWESWIDISDYVKWLLKDEGFKFFDKPEGWEP